MWRSSRSRSSAAKPRLPDDIRVYALTDIHGCSDLLKSMFTVIDRDLMTIGRRRAIHVFLGDYIDRGPDSSGTIELLIERARKHESIFLKGNHETFLFEVLRNPKLLQNWRQYGGLQTLSSYGVQPPLNPTVKEQKELIDQLSAAIPMHHRMFFEHLRASFICGDFFFAHAGIRPGLPLASQREDDLLWIRDEFLLSEKKHEKYIIHGHTPVREPDIRLNRANIDTGAYATGNLTLLTIQGNRLLAF
ncbi:MULTISPECIES: metallophosphoesterase [unclassified Bradyrhizobium]|uniref:metallophosphoesterase n=1 Tax=unclassified Bradyrhizobium TaxID=2631580 RepID=UPI0024786A9B|nr:MULTISPECIES: metallophosphoesterase [unclassified Bradyrhizobium]WGR73501.1 metallophosphoesterase [Bradyrhizobium sp. ISRA426]WGR78338.1 metallophosphoesterase [Bradyrhizobium sp. ISRA430]WGR88739.1 metallophosphoesterase [Bradyrhizobium sp. ISRA432]